MNERIEGNKRTVVFSSGVLKVDFHLMKHNDDVVRHHEDENVRNNSHNNILHIQDISLKKKNDYVL